MHPIRYILLLDGLACYNNKAVHSAVVVTFIWRVQKEKWAIPTSKDHMPVVPETSTLPDDGRSPSPAVHSNDTDDWEIDYSLLKFKEKVANGSFGDL